MLSDCILSISTRPDDTDIYSSKAAVNCCVACAFWLSASALPIAAAAFAVWAAAWAVVAVAAAVALAPTATLDVD